jgi:hypothetical protein
MSDETQNTAPAKTELEVLKDRARVMGITFSPNIGVEALRARIEAKMNGEDEKSQEQEAPQQAQNEINPLGETPTDRPLTMSELRKKIIAEQTRLVRIRITNMDPKKKDLPGEIITVANEFMGTIKKYVPYGEATENGYHVPYCIYDFLKERRFLDIRTKRDKKGQIQTTANYVREFAIEVLDPLTPEELARLANQQAASGSVTNAD